MLFFGKFDLKSDFNRDFPSWTSRVRAPSPAQYKAFRSKMLRKALCFYLRILPRRCKRRSKTVARAGPA